MLLGRNVLDWADQKTGVLMSVDAAFLEGVELFRALDENDRRALAGVMQASEVRAETPLFEQGEAGSSLFVVRSGRVELFVTDRAGQKIVLSHVGPGDVFGELSLLDGRPRSAGARVVDDGELLELDREHLVALVRRIPDLALDLLAQVSRGTRRADELLSERVSRNVNEEIEEHLTPLQRIADWIAWFSGSMPFLMVNILWFIVWIVINTAHTGLPQFDPYPFGLLTMIVSLEAIFLSCFVLISQNRQASKDHMRSDVEYEVNVKAELEIAQLHEKIDKIHERLVQQFGRPEQRRGS
jgi:CRP/FNR family transcriptional regulator, cyclic AMP receptor protein